MVAWRAFVVAVLMAAALGAGLAKTPVAPAQDSDFTEGWRAYSAADYERARSLYRKAAQRNHALSQFNLAVMLIEGQGGAVDTKEGLEWLRKAADAGLARAQYSLGVFYDRGELIAKSTTDAT